MLRCSLLAVLSQRGTRGSKTMRGVAIGPESDVIVNLRAYCLLRRICLDGFIDDKTEN